jgi:hypothetical protein
MTRNRNIALALAVALLVTAIEARADDCQYVRGSISETRISLGTEPTRLLGTVTGVLNGAVTVTLLSLPPSVVRSLDIFVTKSGDVLRAEGLPTPSLSRQPPIPFTRGPCAVRTSKPISTEPFADDVQRPVGGGG